MTTLAAVFRTELIKSKNTFAVWLVGLGAAFVPFLFFLIYLNRWEKFIPKTGENPWIVFFNNCLSTASFILIPFFIVLLSSLIVNIEHKSNAWKHLLTLPVSKSALYLNKLGVIIGLTLMCYGFFVIFTLLAASLLGLFKPKLGFLSHVPDVAQFLKIILQSFVSTLGVLAIHYWLSLRLKNIFVSLGIGLVGIITATVLLSRWDNTVYVPYAYTALTAVPTIIPKTYVNSSFFHFHELFSLVYFGVIGLAGYLDFIRLYRG